MNIAYFCEQQDSGVASHAGATPSFSAENLRQLNTSVFNNTAGVSLSDNLITLQPGPRYELEAETPAYMGANCRAIFWDFTNNIQLGIGRSEWSGIAGPLAAKQNTPCRAVAVVSPASSIQVGVMIYFGPTTSNLNTFGCPTNDGGVEIYTIVKVTEA